MAECGWCGTRGSCPACVELAEATRPPAPVVPIRRGVSIAELRPMHGAAGSPLSDDGVPWDELVEVTDRICVLEAELLEVRERRARIAGQLVASGVSVAVLAGRLRMSRQRVYKLLLSQDPPGVPS